MGDCIDLCRHSDRPLPGGSRRPAGRHPRHRREHPGHPGTQVRYEQGWFFMSLRNVFV